MLSASGACNCATRQVVLVGDSGERDPIVCAVLLRQLGRPGVAIVAGEHGPYLVAQSS